MSLVILKRESRANGELFCIELPYQNIKKTASPPVAEAAGGGVSLPSVRPILRIFARPEGAREWRAHRGAIEFISLMVRGICTRLD